MTFQVPKIRDFRTTDDHIGDANKMVKPAAALPKPDLHLAWSDDGENIRFWTRNAGHAKEWANENWPTESYFSADQMRAILAAQPASNSVLRDSRTTAELSNQVSANTAHAAESLVHDADESPVLTLSEAGKPILETMHGCTMPADYSFECINNFVHCEDPQYEELQYLALGMASHIDALNRQLLAASAVINGSVQYACDRTGMLMPTRCGDCLCWSQPTLTAAQDDGEQDR